MCSLSLIELTISYLDGTRKGVRRQLFLAQFPRRPRYAVGLILVGVIEISRRSLRRFLPHKRLRLDFGLGRTVLRVN